MKRRRAAALVSLAAGIATIGLALAITIRGFPRGLTVLACLLVAVFAAFEGVLRHRGVTQLVAAGIAIAASAGGLALVLFEGRLVGDLLIVIGAALSIAAARVAFAVRVHLPKVPPPLRPVLFFNLRSGGGKARQFQLADEARARGIEPIEMRVGSDLRSLVHEAVERGADGLAMAGGDGSQAIVAEMAAELDLPYTCIPAGTRNHFALDLGVDRDDPVGALDAFVDGGERRVDLCEVNGRVFVNNVSLGLYAEAVQRASYRDAKLRTLLEITPEMLGAEAERSDLRWNRHGSSNGSGTIALLISNNRYRVGSALSSGTRPQLDAGVLGITVLTAADRPKVFSWLGPHWRQWTGKRFEVEATSPVAAGIDGEAAVLDPPLHFLTRRRALKVRVAREHPGASPSAGNPNGVIDAVESLALIVAGRGRQSKHAGRTA